MSCTNNQVEVEDEDERSARWNAHDKAQTAQRSLVTDKSIWAPYGSDEAIVEHVDPAGVDLLARGLDLDKGTPLAVGPFEHSIEEHWLHRISLRQVGHGDQVNWLNEA